MIRRVRAQLLNQLHKGFHLCSGPGQLREIPRIFQHLKKAYFLFPCNGGSPVDGGLADPALRNIDDSLGTDIIPSVVNGSQISKNIPNFHAIVEIVSADDVVRDRFQYQLILQKARLCIRAIQDRKILVGQSMVLLHFIRNVLRDKGCLVIPPGKFPEVNAASSSLVGPELLVLPVFVVRNHCIGRIQNILRRTVILLQTYHEGIRIYLFEIQDVANVRASEFVNRLIIVSHDTQISRSGRQKAHNLKLGLIGVLILIHMNVTKPFLISLQNILSGLQQLHRFHQQIIKIKGIVGPQLTLVLRIYLTDLLLPKAGCMLLLKTMRRLKLVFGL